MSQSPSLVTEQSLEFALRADGFLAGGALGPAHYSSSLMDRDLALMLLARQVSPLLVTSDSISAEELEHVRHAVTSSLLERRFEGSAAWAAADHHLSLLLAVTSVRRDPLPRPVLHRGTALLRVAPVVRGAKRHWFVAMRCCLSLT